MAERLSRKTLYDLVLTPVLDVLVSLADCILGPLCEFVHERYLHKRRVRNAGFGLSWTLIFRVKPRQAIALLISKFF